MNIESKPSKDGVEGRILASAAALFANYGYNGVSTRYIASHAGVNEVTIYRRYSRKRDLYVAVLDAELQQVKLGGDLLARIAEATDAKTVLVRTVELISATLLGRPELVRLIQFGALEFGHDFDPMLRKYLSELVEVVVRYLEPWVSRGDLRCTSAKALVLSMIGITVSHQSLSRLFLGNSSGPEFMFESFASSTTLE